MSTVNVGSALPAGTNTIGNVKLIDTGGTNQAAVDANNNVHVAIYNAANSMGIDANNNAHVGLWNGTNQAAVDSSGNQAIKGNFAEQSSLSAGSLNADLVASTDVSNYKWWSLHVTGTFTGTLTFQGSNDNSNWTSVEGANLATTSSISTTLLSAGIQNLLYAGIVAFRYLRIRMTAYTSGTATGTLELYTFAPPAPIIGAIAAQSGTWTVQPGNTANTTAWKVDGSAVTQPVSGTVTATQATGTNLHVVNDAGSAVIGSVTIQATSGTALVADQTNSELRVSTYVKTTTAGDTALTLGQATMSASLPVTLASNQPTQNVTPQATTTGGSTPSHTMSAASTNATSLKASAGLLYGFCISNANAAARYFKLYNKASAPTVGTDTPVTTIQVPANGTVIRAYPVGMTFSTGIAWAATGLITNADTTAIAANDLSIDIDYL
jgi:hypothetical protein